MLLFLHPDLPIDDPRAVEELAPADPAQADRTRPIDADDCTWCMGQGCMPKPAEQGWRRCDFCRGTGERVPA